MSKKNLDVIEFGGKLKEIRKALNLSLKDMEAISGYSLSSLSEIERNITNPNPKYLLLLAEKFNVNLNWLFTGKGAMFSPGFELSWDFGKDTKTILKLFYLVENCDVFRYEILKYFLEYLDSNYDKIKQYLPDPQKL
jgi:transcriptional regulator with XRE-family HTH domain